LFATTLPGATGITVQVAFDNGDHLSGEFARADTDGVEFRPNVPGLGASVKLKWTGDGVTALNLKAAANAASGCVYLVGTRPDSQIAGPEGGRLCFKSAVVTQGKDQALLVVSYRPIPESDNPSRRAPSGDLNSSRIQSVETASPASPQAAQQAVAAPVTAVAPPPVHTAQFPSIWALNLNAPESIVQGTQSQQLFSGLFRTDLYDGDHDHFAFAASGSHQHNLSLHKPSQRTDIFDSLAQYSHTNSKQYGVYAIGEWFLNTSLGMAAERSGGVGFLLPSVSNKSENLFAKTWVDFRYFNERLYSGKNLDLAGSVIHGEVNYSPSDGSWFITFGMALKPMFNDWGAKQANGSLIFTVPISTHVCATVTPADDTYIGNSPTGFRRNYLKSSVGLTILAGSNSAQKCR
jgi:hypothetical protein